MSKVISALPKLLPICVVDINSQEEVTWDTLLSESITPLLSWVKAETQYLYDKSPTQCAEDALNLKGSANSYSRSCGYAPRHLSLGGDIKAKSRLGELVHYKLMTETASFARNPNPHKKEHSFSRTVNLGAVDSQMAQLEISENTLILTWKCWSREYELTFIIPSYAHQRNITKWSLPVVSNNGFIFTMQETPLQVESSVTAGVDLGRVEPFTLAILSDNGKLAAEYRARPRLRELAHKRERLLKEIKHTRNKAIAYETLKLDSTALRKEVLRLRNKAHRLGNSLSNQLAADLIQKAQRHKVSLLRVEELRWATGKRYGSRWNHGAITDKIEHTSARHGIRTKRINPRNSSQNCHNCNTAIVHNTKTRSIRCQDCKLRLDRDVNAALNIAKNNPYPNGNNRIIRDTPSTKQGVTQQESKSMIPITQVLSC